MISPLPQFAQLWLRGFCNDSQVLFAAFWTFTFNHAAQLHQNRLILFAANFLSPLI